MKSKLIYPPSPETRDISFLSPHAEFEANVKRVAWAILLFLLTYFLLLVVSGIVCYLCVLGAIFLITHLYHLLLIFVALCLLIFGVMIFVFMLKFVFIRNQTAEENQVEIFEKDQPHLFAFIRKVAEDTFNQMPKHVYIARGVNASVSADSQLLSFFFASPKNLTIGLGIVNTLNISEFKSVLAHEFGHFSQKSTHFGRYVYAFYLMLYNWIYAEDNWDNMLSKLLYSGLKVIRITGWFILSSSNVIKRLMAYLFRFVQKNYMRLSREMEYNADKMAVCLAGNEASISALRKVEMSDACMYQSFQHAAWAASQQKKLPNIYAYHRFLMRQWGEKNGIEMAKNRIPKISSNAHIKQTQPNVVYKDQWASHPSNEDRTLKMNEISLKCSIVEESAWVLFENAGALQAEMTNAFFAQFMEFESLPNNPISPTELGEMVRQDDEKNAYPQAYNGFYDDRGISQFEVKAVLLEKKEILSSETPCNEVFTKEKTETIQLFFTNAQDAIVLQNIASGEIETPFFEYKGKRYAQKEAKNIVETLQKEINKQEAEIAEYDKQAFLFHYYLILAHNFDDAVKYINYYSLFFHWRMTWDSMLHFKQDYEEKLNDLFSHKPIDTDIANAIIQFVFEKENELKKILKNIDNEQLDILKANQNIANYIEKNLAYFYSKEHIEGKVIQDFANFVALIHDTCLAEYRQTWRQIMLMQFPWVMENGE